VRTELSEALEYEAVMMIKPFGTDVWLDVPQQEILIEYINAGGHFYVEGFMFRNFGIDDPMNPLWDTLGLTGDAMASSSLNVDSVFGVTGTFAEGISVKQPYDPTREDALSGYLVQGSLSGVLGISATYLNEIAWESMTKPGQAIFLWPIATGYYDEFIARVVCTYFQLCELDVKADSPEQPRLRYLPATSEIVLPEQGRVVIRDLLGRILFDAGPTDDRVRVPLGLPRGTLLVMWSSGDRKASMILPHF
jgi:hypothetical protein